MNTLAFMIAFARHVAEGTVEFYVRDSMGIPWLSAQKMVRWRGGSRLTPLGAEMSLSPQMELNPEVAGDHFGRVVRRGLDHAECGP